MKRAAEIEIIERKALGLGFEDLISDSLSGVKFLKSDKKEEKINALFNLAVFAEDNKKISDALFYYRSIIEIFEKNRADFENGSLPSNNPIMDTIIKSMNNLGVICYELNLIQEAVLWFNKILEIDKENKLAIENLEILKSEKNNFL